MTVAANTAWLTIDHAVRLLLGLVVHLLIARHLGPAEYGLLAYALAICAICGVVAGFGLHSVVVNALVRSPGERGSVLGSACVLRLASGLVAAAAAVIIALLLESPTHRLVAVTAFCAFTHIAATSGVIELHFESQVQAANYVPVRIATVVAKVAAVAALVRLGAPLLWFAALWPVSSLLHAALLVGAYRRAADTPREWRWDRMWAFSLVRSGWPLFLAAGALVVYTRIDQIMLARMVGPGAVGIYAVAIRISEAGYLIPAALATSVFPSLVAAHGADRERFQRLLHRFMRTVSLTGIVMALTLAAAAGVFIPLLFGAGFSAAIPILRIHAWSNLFACMGIASKHWFIINGLQRYTLYRTVAGCLLNIALNLLLIPRLGAAGAAWATVVAHAGALYLFNAFSKATRPVFVLQSRALLFLPPAPSLRHP